MRHTALLVTALFMFALHAEAQHDRHAMHQAAAQAGYATDGNEILVVGTDYGYEAPEVVKAGWNVITFVNEGVVRHEMLVFPLNEGIGAAELRKAQESNVPWASVRDTYSTGRILGMLAVPGEEASAGKLLVNLERGRSYALICNFKDAESAPTHFVLGMHKVIRAE